MKMENRFCDGFRIFCGNSFVDGVYLMPEWNLDECIQKAVNHEGILCYLTALDGDIISETMLYHPTYGEIEDEILKVKTEIEARDGVKSWVNCEAMGEEKEILRKYLLGHGYDFEISGCGYGMSHFEILCTDAQRDIIQVWMDANM